MITFLIRNLIWRESLPLALASIGLLIISLFFAKLLIISVPLLLFLFYFFRFPTRHSRAEPDAILAPADGRVISIVEHTDRPYKYHVAIFLSPFDVHVMWTPVTGFVTAITHQPGQFLPAFLGQSGMLNEQNDLTLRVKGHTVVVRQIAGMLARRIVCWPKKGNTLPRGQAYGMITFGSRVDLFLPHVTELTIKHNQRLVGGETVVARFIAH